MWSVAFESDTEVNMMSGMFQKAFEGVFCHVKVQLWAVITLCFLSFSPKTFRLLFYSQMPSHDKIIFNMLFGEFHITSRQVLS